MTQTGVEEVESTWRDDNHFETGRPRLGGIGQPVRFDSRQTAVFEAIADTMIPKSGNFPAPSEVGVVDFAGRYTTPSGYRAKHFPFVEEDAFKESLDQLALAVLDGEQSATAGEIARVEQEQPGLFEQLRALVYFGYYSAPEVTLAIRRSIPAGSDYHGPPMPYGYLDSIEDWNEDRLAAKGRGSYLATDEVRRIDLTTLSWIHTH